MCLIFVKWVSPFSQKDPHTPRKWGTWGPHISRKIGSWVPIFPGKREPGPHFPMTPTNPPKIDFLLEAIVVMNEFHFQAKL